MYTFGKEERGMLAHTAQVMGDILCEGDDGFTDEDERAVSKLGLMGKTDTTCLVLTGNEADEKVCRQMMRDVISAEVADWVPNASQRLLHRAGRALGHEVRNVLTDRPDCGAEPSWHALVRDWVLGETFMRCVSCGRLYRDAFSTQSDTSAKTYICIDREGNTYPEHCEESYNECMRCGAELDY